MDPLTMYGIGAGVGAIADLAGSSMSADAIKENAQAEREFQYNMFNHNKALQYEFAKNGLTWKVQDAVNAGLHPLAALGTQGVSFSPIQVGGGGVADTSMGPGLSAAGQNISRAMMAAANSDQRAGELLDAQIMGQKLDNEHKALMIRQQSQIGPPMPTNGMVAPSPAIVTKPNEVVASSAKDPSRVYGARPSAEYVIEQGGNRLTPVMPAEVAEQFENDLIGNINYQARNRLLPLFGVNVPRYPDPKEFPLPDHQKWEWDYTGWVRKDIRPWKLRKGGR